MKNRILFVVLLSCFSLLMMSHSCSTECGVDCGANGECLEGECYCGPGYFGTYCESTIVSDFPGTYTGSVEYVATDTSFTKTDDITVAVTNAGNLELSIGPLTSGDDTVSGTAGSGQIDIPQQAVTQGTFAGTLQHFVNPNSQDFQLVLNGQWNDGTRTYTITAEIFRPI